MKVEVQKILKLFVELEEACETASLTFSTSGGKSLLKLQLQSSHPHLQGQLLVQHQFLAAAHHASLAEAATTTSASLDTPPPRPLSLLQSQPPESGRRQVKAVTRLEMPTFFTLNMDGPKSSPTTSPRKAP